jgi:formate dehydrogenase subunit delta
VNVEKLVRMANQIAANFEYGPDKQKAADSVAEHLRRFWSPPMRAQIIEYFEHDGAGLCEVAAMAVAKLKTGTSAA